MSRATSTDESSLVMDILTPFLEIFVGKGNVTIYLVRKLAHITEYFVLGSEVYVYLRLSGDQIISKTNWGLMVGRVLLCGLIVAFLDETIQIFSGRGPQIVDIWIDLFGVVIACAICSFITFIKGKTK